MLEPVRHSVTAMRSLFHRRIGSVLGLLAILMATLAPTVSHTVAADQRFDAIPRLVYPMSAGRNFDEVLRLLDALQLNAKHAVATPVNWKPGEDVIIPTSVSDEDAKKKYPQGFKTLKPYLRTVSQPK
jgi:hypothetical protein